MVKEKIQNGKTYYQCEICKFYYKEKKWAEKCEAWCDEKHSCNIDVVKHAVNLDEEEKGEALAIKDTRGMIRMILDHKTKQVVGVEIVSPMAADIITTAVYAIKK